MELALRPAVVWLLALLMPFQALTAVYLDVRGPAHFHVAADGARHGLEYALAAEMEHGHGRPHEYSHVIQSMGLTHGLDRGHPHSHDQYGLERHHHHPGDTSVVTVRDHGLAGDFPLKEETTSGWSGAMLVTLPAGGLAPRSLAGVDALAPRPEPLLETRSLGRLDRPPRTLPG